MVLAAENKRMSYKALLADPADCFEKEEENYEKADALVKALIWRIFITGRREIYLLKAAFFDMHPKSWTAFGGAYFYVKEKEIQHKVLARV